MHIESDRQVIEQVTMPPQPSGLMPHSVLLHVAGLQAAQWPVLSHIEPMQSLVALHACPTAHAGQVPPPQSVSVSLPFFAWSVQVARTSHVEPGAQ